MASQVTQGLSFDVRVIKHDEIEPAVVKICAAFFGEKTWFYKTEPAVPEAQEISGGIFLWKVPVYAWAEIHDR